MADVGLRELKAKASQIIREVKEQRARYVVTLHGRPVALIVPIEEPQAMNFYQPVGQDETAWQELLQLGEKISTGWDPEHTSLDILQEMRDP